MQKYFKIIAISVLVILVTLTLAACEPARRPAPAPEPDPGRTRIDDPAPGADPRAPDAPRDPRDPRTVDPRAPETPRDPMHMDNITNRANRIADRVTDLNEVEKSAVVITGRTALVGVEVSERLEGRLTDAQKDKVEDRVLATDNAIDTVVVTADPDLFDRIRGLSRDIQGGRPISGLIDEIDEIINRIKPTAERQ